MKKRKPNWKKHGMKSNGLYHNHKKVLTDTPALGEHQIELLKDYINKYISDNERMPSFTHLNKFFNYNATKEYYRSIIK